MGGADQGDLAKLDLDIFQEYLGRGKYEEKQVRWDSIQQGMQYEKSGRNYVCSATKTIGSGKGDELMKIEFAKPPAEELSDQTAPPRKAAKIGLEALSKRKSALIIDDNNSIHAGESQSLPIFMSAFKTLGYDVKLEKSNETIYTTWKGYDIVVWSCSDDYSAVNTTKYMQMLIEYVDKGGRILLESGNVAAWAEEYGEDSPESHVP